MSSQPSPELKEIFARQRSYMMWYLHRGVHSVITGQYRFENQIHPTADLQHRWGRLPGFGMAGAYDLVEAHINREWMLKEKIPLTDEGEYRRHIQRNAAHYLVQVLTTENIFQGLCLRYLPDHNDIVPAISSFLPDAFVTFRDRLCWAVMYETAYSTRNDSIRPTNGQSYTWYDLRGDAMHDIYNKARSKLAHNWANRIAGRPYAGLYEAVRHILRTSKLQVLNQRISDNFDSVIGISERVVTPTPPNSESGSPRAQVGRPGSYDPTDGMDL